jgi:hypothetical protein
VERRAVGIRRRIFGAVVVTFPSRNDGSGDGAGKHKDQRRARIQKHHRREQAEDGGVPHEHCCGRKQHAAIGCFQQSTGCGARARRKLCDGDSAVDQASEKTSELDAARTIELQEDVVREAERGDQDHGHPCGARLDEVPRVHTPCGKYGVDDEAEDRQENR